MVSGEDKTTPVCCHINQTHRCPRHTNRKKEGKYSAEVEPEERGRPDEFHPRSETGDSDEKAKRPCECL